MENKDRHNAVYIDCVDTLGGLANRTTIHISKDGYSSVIGDDEYMDDFDHCLAIEAARRLAEDDGNHTSLEDLMEELGITDERLDQLSTQLNK